MKPIGNASRIARWISAPARVLTVFRRGRASTSVAKPGRRGHLFLRPDRRRALRRCRDSIRFARLTDHDQRGRRTFNGSSTRATSNVADNRARMRFLPKVVCRRFNRFDDPFVLTPGDNEWTDCQSQESPDVSIRWNAFRNCGPFSIPVPGMTLGQAANAR